MAHVQTFGYRMIPLNVALPRTCQAFKRLWWKLGSWDMSTCCRSMRKSSRSYVRPSTFCKQALVRGRQGTHSLYSRRLIVEIRNAIIRLGICIRFWPPIFRGLQTTSGPSQWWPPQKKISQNPLNACDQVSRRFKWDNSLPNKWNHQVVYDWHPCLKREKLVQSSPPCQFNLIFSRKFSQFILFRRFNSKK